MTDEHSRRQSPFWRLHFRRQDNTRDQLNKANSIASSNNVTEASSREPHPSEQSGHTHVENNNSRFNRRVQETIEAVGYRESIEDHVPGNLVILERETQEATRKLKLVCTEYRPSTIWENINFGLDQLHSTWAKIKEASYELLLYVPVTTSTTVHRRNSSMESTLSDYDFTRVQSTCSLVLTRTIKDAYDAFESYLNIVFNLMALAFQEEDKNLHLSSIDHIAAAARAVRVLGMALEVDQELKGISGAAFEFLSTELFLERRKESIRKLIEALCHYIESLQEILFQRKYLYAKGRSSIRKLRNMSETMRRCWHESALLFRQLSKLCPEIKPTIDAEYSHVLCHAGSLLSTMQDSFEIHEFLTEPPKLIKYDDEVIGDLLQTQLWLIPCLNDLLTLSKWCMKRMKVPQSSESKGGMYNSNRFESFKRMMYDLVMVTIARASWLMSWMNKCPDPELINLKEQGSKTLMFVYNYTKSKISLNCGPQNPIEDISLHGALVHSTDSLMNTLHTVHEMIQTKALLSPSLEGSSSSTLTTHQDVEEADTILFHKVGGIQWHTLCTVPSSLNNSRQSIVAGKLHSETIGTSAFTKEGESQHDDELPIIKPDQETEDRVDPVRQLHSPLSDAVSVSLPNGFLDLLPEQNSEIQPSLSEEIEHWTSSSDPSREDADIQSRGLFTKESMKTELPSLKRTRMSKLKSKFKCCACLKAPETNSPELHYSHNALTAHHSTLIPDPELNLPVNQDARELTGELLNEVREGLMEGEVLGSGSGGNVWKMMYRETPVAVKIIHESSVNSSQKRFNEAVNLHCKISPHPNIVKFIGSYHPSHQQLNGSNPSSAMIMELCELGDLFKILCEARWIQDKKNFDHDISKYEASSGYLLYSDWALRVQVARDIAAGVAHMHHNGIVHRDLTSYNIVIKNEQGRQWVAKVCDFDRSREVPATGFVPRSDTFANSPAWAAPEVLGDQDYSIQADVYSMGVILWELITLKNPNELYEHSVRVNRDFSHRSIREQLLSELYDFSAPDLPEIMELRTAILKCLNEVAHARPTMQELHSLLTHLHEIIQHRFY
eukprot:g5135.t1